MANNLITPTLITRTAAEFFDNNLAFGAGIDWDWEENFGGKNAIGQVGQTIQIRKKPMPKVIQSATWSSQDIVEGKVALAVAEHFQVPLQFTGEEFALKIEDFTERYIEPSLAILGAQIDAFMYAQAINGTPTSSLDSTSVSNAAVANVVGTYGTALTSDTIYAATQKLREYATPPDAWNGILTPKATHELSKDQIAFFNPQKEISSLYRKNLLGYFSNAEWSTSQSALAGTHTNGAWAGSPVIASASDVTSGWQQNFTITVNGFTAATTINAGDVFTIAGVYAANPLNKYSLGYLAQWVVLSSVASAVASGQQLVIAPAPFDPANGYANITAAPANGAALTLVGTASSSGQESLLFHKTAFAAASPKLPLPTAVDSASQHRSKAGVNIAFTKTWDAVNYRWICRFDTLLAFAVVTPEYACRIRD